MDDQQQSKNQYPSDPRSRYEEYHLAAISSTQSAYGHLGTEAAEFIAGMIEFLRYEFPVDCYTREERPFYRDRSKFLQGCLALPEKERSQKALTAIEAVVEQMFPRDTDEQRRSCVSSFYFLFNHAISNYKTEKIFAESKQEYPQPALE